MLFPVAHIAELAQQSPLRTLAIVLALVFCVGLAVEHSVVKNQGFRPHQLRSVFGIVAALTLALVAAPVPGFAQTTSEPVGLPDLISDPPSPDRTRMVRTPQGELIRVIAFDGYIHNIGTGKLHVSGNPQEPGGMQQRVFDGEEWTTVGTPTVLFETSDGHNHFHLMRAIDYGLWSSDRTEQVTDASKVGFCLVDTEQREEGHDSNYLITDFNYCGVDDPGSTDLVMGITPGWRDTYDSNVTLQWIDISNTKPGNYWISAVTDPNNEIVESNEDNNDLVFSTDRAVVDGFVARPLDQHQAGEPIVLKTDIYGAVGARAFVIAEGPANGTLDVPTQVDLLDTDTVVYSPDPGFSGTDTFSYYAHDITTPFPLEPTVVEVTISVDEPASTGADDTSAASSDLSITGQDAYDVKVFEETQIEFAIDGPDADQARWFAHGLPPGLSIDIDTGTVVGVPTFFDDFDADIVAIVDGQRIERSTMWSVAEQPALALTPVNNLSTSSAELLRLPIGSGTDGATYRGTGLPEGGVVVPNQPLLTGVGREVGTFAVTIEEVIDDQVVSSIDFEWTIRPSTRPSFPL